MSRKGPKTKGPAGYRSGKLLSEICTDICMRIHIHISRGCTLGGESWRNFDPVCGASKLELYRRQNKTPLLFFYCYTTTTTATAEHTKYLPAIWFIFM